jgi:hypothetical protein
MSVSYTYFKYFIYFKRMLQVLYLDISKVDQMLHMLQCDLPAAAAEEDARDRMECGPSVYPDVRPLVVPLI